MAEHQREGTPEEISQRLHWSVEKYNFVAEQLKSIVSLDAPLKNGGSKDGKTVAVLDLVKGKKQDGFVDLLSATLKEGVHEIVEKLPDREAYVLKQRYGLGDAAPKTLA